MTPKRTSSSGVCDGSRAGLSGSVRLSSSSSGRDGSGEGAVASRSATQAFQEGAMFLASGSKGQKVVGGQSSKAAAQRATTAGAGAAASQMSSWPMMVLMMKQALCTATASQMMIL